MNPFPTIFHRRALVPWAALLLAVALMAAACGNDDDGDGEPTAAADTPTSAASPTADTGATPGPDDDAAPGPGDDRLAGVPGIVDPTNLDWPREVEGLNGRVAITEPPTSIHTMSAGIDEITIALVSTSRIVAVGSATQNPDSSTFADVVQDLPTVAREPEAIASLHPDLVIATPVQGADVVSAIERLEIPVVQLALDPTPEGRIGAILLLGYIYGEEERAFQLVDEVQSRYDAVVDITSGIPESDRPVVLSTTKYTAINISGAGTTFEGIIVAAGGVNGGTEAGMEGNQIASVEAIVVAAPDIIILPMAGEGGGAFRDELLSDAALAETPAVRDGRVYVVPPQLYTTNSFANVRAVEHLAHILWPEEFPAAETDQFSLPADQ